jgi:hypothetical protein
MRPRYPNQVLRAGQAAGDHDVPIEAACVKLQAAPRRHTARKDNCDYMIFCFPTSTAAETFKAIFSGESFTPS